jgi:hypothetical protein
MSVSVDAGTPCRSLAARNVASTIGPVTRTRWLVRDHADYLQASLAVRAGRQPPCDGLAVTSIPVNARADLLQLDLVFGLSYTSLSRSLARS